MIDILPERPEDGPAIESLLDAAFGPQRLAKSSYDYRQDTARLWPLCLVVRAGRSVIGTIRCWPVRVGSAEAPEVLVGPVAIALPYRNHGLGATLVRRSLGLARGAGFRLALLVGDAAYYGRFGFIEAAQLGIAMRRESVARVLALPLASDTRLPTGLVQPWGSVRRLPTAA